MARPSWNGPLRSDAEAARVERLKRVREMDRERAARRAAEYRRAEAEESVAVVRSVRAGWEALRERRAAELAERIGAAQNDMGAAQRAAADREASTHSRAECVARERRDRDAAAAARGAEAADGVARLLEEERARREEREAWRRRAREQAGRARERLAADMERRRAALPRSVANPFAPGRGRCPAATAEAERAAAAAPGTGPGAAAAPPGVAVEKYPHHSLFRGAVARRGARRAAADREAEAAAARGALGPAPRSEPPPAPAELPSSAFEAAGRAAATAEERARREADEGGRREAAAQARGRAARRRVAAAQTLDEQRAALEAVERAERQQVLAESLARGRQQARAERHRRLACDEFEDEFRQTAFERELPALLAGAPPPPPDHPTFLPRNDPRAYSLDHPARREAAARLVDALNQARERALEEEEGVEEDEAAAAAWQEEARGDEEEAKAEVMEERREPDVVVVVPTAAATESSESGVSLESEPRPRDELQDEVANTLARLDSMLDEVASFRWAPPPEGS